MSENKRPPSAEIVKSLKEKTKNRRVDSGIKDTRWKRKPRHRKMDLE